MPPYRHIVLLCLLLLPVWGRAAAQEVPVLSDPSAGSDAFLNRLERLRSEVALRPKDAAVRLQYAEALYEAELFTEASVQYQAYLDDVPGTPFVVRRYLVALSHDPRQARRGEQAAERYLAYYPTDSDLHMRLGYFRLWQGKADAAEEAFLQALRLEPGDADALRGLREVEDIRAREQALSTFRPGAEEDLRRQDERRFLFVRELLRNQRYYAAYQELDVLSQRHGEARRWLTLYAEADRGLIRSEGGTPAYPVDRYTYLVRLYPDSLDLRYALVDALVAAERPAEAYDVLVAPAHVDPAAPAYRERLQAVEAARVRLAEARTADLEARLARQPGDLTLTRALIEQYLNAGRADDALALYAGALEQRSNDEALRRDYARALRDHGRLDEALRQADYLLQQHPDEADDQLFYARVALSANQVSERVERYLRAALDRQPDDVDALLDMATLRLLQHDPREADRYLRRAFATGIVSDEQRVRQLDLLIERALVQLHREEQAVLLNEARRLAAAGDYEAALQRYEDYFDARGKRTRAELVELASVHSAAGDYMTALSILETLQSQTYTLDVAKASARNRYYLGDHSGAIATLETLLERNPRDMEARMLLQDIYLETDRHQQARAVYHERVVRVTRESKLSPFSRRPPRPRIDLVERPIHTDYVGLIVPVSQYVGARGNITDYEHWAQGVNTQVTLPVPIVVTAGLTSHFLSGSRSLVPGAPITGTRINQVFAGGFFDFTPSLAFANAPYTNRLWFQFGIYDYSGGRTAGFGEVRFMKQQPGLYTASIGMASTEAAPSLWAPAGGEFGLRLTQFDARARVTGLLPDSLLVFSGGLSYNIVQGDPDSTVTGTRTNHGTNFRLEASVRVLPFTRLGLAFNRMHYRENLETYFSPQDYHAYDLWLEYEAEVLHKWYFRTRGTIGLVAYQRGAFASRLEADVIYRFMSRLSASLSASAGQSSRFLSRQGGFRDDQYRMVQFSAALYWTL